MIEDQDIPRPHSIYHLGAQDGLIVGVYMSVMYWLQVTGLSNSFLLLVSEVMLLGLPVLAFVLLRRAYISTKCTSRLSAIWMHGIVIFLCGSLLMGLTSYLYMRLVNPTFIVDLFNMVSQFYIDMGTPEAEHIGITLQRIIDLKMLPSPISFAFSMIWLGGFSGAIFSLIIACILRWTIKPKDTVKDM